MIFIPTWVINILLLISCVLAGYQHWRLNRANPVTNFQFVAMVFALLMVVVVTISNGRSNPWLSFAFFVVAAGVLTLTVRQHRMLPPGKAFE